MKSSRLSQAQRREMLRIMKSSPSYLKAYEDERFLRHESLRPVRLQLELLKPEMTLRADGIRSTVVLFGSARIHPPEEARELVESKREELRRRPRDREALHAFRAAERLLARSRYYDQARRFAALATRGSQKGAHREFVIVTGGGPGIMEAANRGAHEAGGKSIGLNITLPHEQDPNPYITPGLCFQFHYFAIRKMHFLMRCKALVVFPGGFGTMDELFETLTLVQTGKKRPFPILLFGREFWSRLIDFEYLADQGMISREDLNLFRYVETAGEAWSAVERYWRKNRIRVR